MELIDVVMKLNGPVSPVGDSRIDADRLANLKTLCDLTDELLGHIASIAQRPDDYMASVKAAKSRATTFLLDMADSLPTVNAVGTCASPEPNDKGATP